MGEVHEIIQDNKDYECITNDDAVNYVVPKSIAKEIRADERKKAIAPFEREMATLNRVEWSPGNLACFVFRIQEIIEQMKGVET